VITGDLDAELARSLSTMAADGDLPASAIRPAPGTWRPDPSRDPATFATSLPFEVARMAGQPPQRLAAALAVDLARVPWIEAAIPAGSGYLTLTVTASALAEVARRIVAAGTDCARSTALGGICAPAPTWPDLAAARTWPEAWAAQAAAMQGRLVEAAGGCATPALGPERAGFPAHASDSESSPVADAVAYLGVDVIRYRLARTHAADSRLHGMAMDSGRDLYEGVQRAHAETASVLRWAADLGIGRPDQGISLGTAVGSIEERILLGLLSWLPERVASAARRSRPDEVPRYLEDVAEAWTACRLGRPALPFGGMAASSDPYVQAARLLLADAARTVLATGLALCGLTARDRI
jgi:arginyl-tRNA synthetase